MSEDAGERDLLKMLEFLRLDETSDLAAVPHVGCTGLAESRPVRAADTLRRRMHALARTGAAHGKGPCRRGSGGSVTSGPGRTLR